MFTGGDGIAFWGVHANDAPLARRGNIHVIEAYSRPSDNGELLRVVDDFFGDLRDAPDGQPVIILDDAFQFIRCEVCHYIDLNPGCVLQYFNALGSKGIAYENFFHNRDPPEIN